MCVLKQLFVLFDLLKRSGITESEINTASFTALESAVGTEAVGLAIPEDSNASFPLLKDLITLFAQAVLIRFYLDNDNKWKVERTGPAGSVNKTVRDDELLLKSLMWKYGYKDLLSDITVRYNIQELSNSGQATSDRATATSTTAKFLHKVSKSRIFDSIHFRSADATSLATKLSDIFGERKGQLTFSVKNRFFDSLINEVIKVERTKIPGFSFDKDTLRTRNFVIDSTSKSLKKVEIQVNDQLGIENNSGDF